MPPSLVRSHTGRKFASCKISKLRYRRRIAARRCASPFVSRLTSQPITAAPGPARPSPIDAVATMTSKTTLLSSILLLRRMLSSAAVTAAAACVPHTVTGRARHRDPVSNQKDEFEDRFDRHDCRRRQ